MSGAEATRPLPPPALPLAVVLRCAGPHARRARYTLDTLLLAAGIPVQHANELPAEGPCLLYADEPPAAPWPPNLLYIAHHAQVWRQLDDDGKLPQVEAADGLPLLSAKRRATPPGSDSIEYDLPANAFHFLASRAERRTASQGSRRLHAASECAQLGLPQDIVDRYLARLDDRLRALCRRLQLAPWPAPPWPGGGRFALVLSHDVDFLPVRRHDNLVQGVKTVARHLLRQRDPGDAWRAARGFAAAMLAGRDPYGCVPELIARERALGLRSSFQVAVGQRHPDDVNYRIEDDAVRDYLRAITDAGFDLCLHGSYRSTEDAQWYVQEAALLERRLARPLGSRQHFLSFDYDRLFAAQEAAGIRYDMSMGYPDRPGPRAGFSFPYFPYNLAEDRPYRVLEISLFLMDVTLRAYLGLRPAQARDLIEEHLTALRDKCGAASTVWHPIVFGGARDPGYDQLFFDMAERVRALGGLATDGRSVDAHWRSRARAYPSFDFA